ncbi:MAG TPA: DUF5666 domain-containing protein [Candidatus Paceibacterota bacterium]|nr:DUF5666 domain-containing protein [Candidatus Paceibacterota bacterium]
MNKNLIVTGAVALIVGAGLGYFGSTAFAKAPARGAAFAARGSFTASSSAFARGGNQAAGAVLAGTVAAKDAGSITLDTRDGSSHVVLLTPATAVEKTVAGSLADIAVGSAVSVTGSTNSDGSLSASAVELRPAGLAGAPMIPAGAPAR